LKFNKLRKIFILLCFVFVLKLVYSQDIILKYKSASVNKILSDISSTYNIHLSFDETNLSEYTISIDGKYSSAEQAINALLVNLPFRVKKVENVIVITPFRIAALSDEQRMSKDAGNELKSSDKQYINGTVISSVDGERLPYAYISFDGRGYYTDLYGRFNIILPENIPVYGYGDSLKVAVSYLGYNSIDVKLIISGSNQIFLNPSFSLLDTVTVKDYYISKAMQTGNIPGLIRVNYNIARFLPGNGDNAVFNLLKMMPGVRASGEPSFLSVWGSANGESVIRVDGYRLFSLNNFKDQISSINPFIVKEIILNKGGFDATKGDATGAIVEVIGIDGDKYKPVFKSNINNLTMNLFASAPISNSTVVMSSYRQTYYNLYDVDKLNPFGRGSQTSPTNSSNEILIKPDYSFKDLNIRFKSLLSKRSGLMASFYYAQDNFNYTVDYADNSYDASERNNQYAFSLIYDKEWGDFAGKTTFTGYYSSNFLDAHNVKRYRSQSLLSISTENQIGEGGMDLLHKINTGKSGKLDAGISLKRLFYNINDVNISAVKSTAFLNETLVFKDVDLNIGLRLDNYLGRFYFQPRFQSTYKITDNLKLTIAAGIYNQFLNKVPFKDDSNNYSYIWRIANNDTTPVVSSLHTVLGTTYSKKGWLLTIEGYYKKSSDLLRLSRYKGSTAVVNTNVEVKGVDLFIDKEIKGSNIFLSASLSQIKENPQPANYPEREYSPVEIKTGAVISISPFYISSALFYGSGYLNLFKNAFDEEYVNNDYSRFDISLNYKLIRNKFSLEAGLSLMNLFNSSNYKYIDALPFVTGGQNGVLNIYSKSVPFTPVLSVQIVF